MIALDIICQLFTFFIANLEIPVLIGFSWFCNLVFS